MWAAPWPSSSLLLIRTPLPNLNQCPLNVCYNHCHNED